LKTKFKVQIHHIKYHNGSLINWKKGLNYHFCYVPGFYKIKKPSGNPEGQVPQTGIFTLYLPVFTFTQIPTKPNTAKVLSIFESIRVYLI